MGQIGYLQNAISLTHTVCVASRENSPTKYVTLVYDTFNYIFFSKVIFKNIAYVFKLKSNV